MFEQAFKNIDDVLRKEAGYTTETGLHRASLLAALPEISRRLSKEHHACDACRADIPARCL
jgi:hypothetical protein